MRFALVVILACSVGLGCESPSNAGTAASGSGSGSLESTATGTSGGLGASSGGSSGSSASSGDSALLRFAFTGDTRPNSADDVANYPTPVVDQIIADMRTKDIAFALDTGDHLKVGRSDSRSHAIKYANEMMQLYQNATLALGKPFFMTMGNHECWDHTSLCDSSDPVLGVFMTYVNKQISTPTPYYTFDVATPLGVATFIFVADTAWDSAQATWLQAALAHGDGSAYTLIAKHIPSSNTSDFPTNLNEMQIIESHKFALLLDSHAHLYLHAGEDGREVTLGLGGAPLADAATDSFGYGLVEQQPDGSLKVTEYDAATDLPKDSFSVGPNQQP